MPSSCAGRCFAARRCAVVGLRYAAGLMSRPDPSTPDRGDLRQTLIDEGRRLLEVKGARDLSLREVARRSGVSEAAPFRHFEGKEGLLAAIAASGFRELAAERQPVAASSADAQEKARQMMSLYVGFARRHTSLFDLMIGPTIVRPGLYPELVAATDLSFELFAQSVVALAREHGWPEEAMARVIHAAWSVEHGLATLIIGTRVPRARYPLRLEQMIEFSIAMLLSAIRGGPQALAAVQPGSGPRGASPRGASRPGPAQPRTAQPRTAQPGPAEPAGSAGAPAGRKRRT